LKGAAEGCAVGRGEVACGVVSGKFLARPCAVARHDASVTSLHLAPSEEQLAPLVQCCSQKTWVEGTAQGNETKAGQEVLGPEAVI
jgi:hypothetical protein